jgi:hypothetical protein
LPLRAERWIKKRVIPFRGSNDASSVRFNEEGMTVAKKSSRKAEVVGFVGVGLDGDGEQRITRSEHFFLLGGTQETHERMQDTAIRFSEKLGNRGTPLHETPVEVVIDILREAQE